jgi:LDH2 family malate/lactate/ureidoglycolate dehydrogenase
VPPFVIDFAFGTTAHRKIRVYGQKGRPIPEGWAFHTDGRPTTDAAAALMARIQPIGEHKGVGLAMAIGMLSNLLSGAAYGTESGNMIEGAKPGCDGHFFAAINIAAFRDLDQSKSRVDTIVDQVHGSRRALGVEQLLVPGEIESDIEAAAYREKAILLAGTSLDAIAATAASLGLDATPLFVEVSSDPRQP